MLINNNAAISPLSIPPFYTMEMMRFSDQLEREGKRILHMEVGQPIQPTPQLILDAARDSLSNKKIAYCSALGLRELREAIAKHYQDFYGITLSPNRVVITPGSSLGLYLSLLCNFQKGDTIAVASPSYPCYRNIIRTLGYNLIELSTRLEDNYLITPEVLSLCKEKISGILVASPNNPTGSMYSADSLKSLCDYCRKEDIMLLSDEIYHGISYEEKSSTALQFNENAFVINGFSKYFSMTGWRLGWMVVPEEDMQSYESLLQNMILCTSSLIQYAAIKSFDCYQEFDNYVLGYKKNREMLINALHKAGLNNFHKPAGAFYLYLELPHISMDSMTLCKKILSETGVAVAPGIDFVGEPNTCAIRLSFCQDSNTVSEGAEIVSRFLSQL